MRNDDIAADPELDAFVADAAVYLESALRERPRPDFHEVVARARRDDPAAIGVAMVEESARLATVVPLGSGREPIAADPELDHFIADARSAMDEAIDERRLAGIPSPQPALPGPRRRVVPAALAIVAIAAAIAMMIGPPRAGIVDADGPGRPTQALMQGAADTVHEVERRPDEAPDRQRAGATDRDAPEAAEDRDPVPSDSLDATATDAEQAPEAPSAGHQVPTREFERGPIDAPSPARGRAPRRPPAGDEDDRPRSRDDGGAAPITDAAEFEAELAALDVEAQARWRAGDRRGAEARFRAILDRAPDGRWAQIAYGDLFALARQIDDAAAEVALWREYLARHPRGPHADDARAGLCRRSAGAERRACWQAYLDASPTGAYRRQAARELAEEAQEP